MTDEDRAQGHEGANTAGGGAGGEGAGAEGGAGIDQARIAELIEMARRDIGELPVGAEDFALALRAVAGERDELLARWQRTAADFQNYQRRAQASEREARQLGAAGVAQSALMIVDFFDYALRMDPAKSTAEQVLGGVRMIKAELLRVLGGHGVGLIEPGPGAEFDPLRHEAVDRIEPPAGVEPGRVAALLGAGYTLGDRVIKPARVAVALRPEGPGAAGGPGGSGGAGGAGHANV